MCIIKIGYKNPLVEPAMWCAQRPPRRLTAAQRRVQVMDYKLLGASERQIAGKKRVSQADPFLAHEYRRS